MFTIQAQHSNTFSVHAENESVRIFFTEIKNFIDLMPNIARIRNDNSGVTHWTISTNIPFVGHFSEHFPIVRTENSDERVEWSPQTDEKRNLMRFAADFLPVGPDETTVKLSQHIELRRDSPTEFHLLAGFAGESLISSEMTKRVAEMVDIFIEKAKNRLERDR